MEKMLIVFLFVIPLAFGCQSHSALEKPEPNDALLLDSLLDLSLDQIFDHRYGEAKATLDLIRGLSLSRRDSARWAKNENNFGLRYFFMGEYDSSIIQYNHFLAYAKQGGDSAAVAETYKNIGISWKAMGYYEEAIQHYIQALTCNPDQRHSFTASLHNSLGNLYLNIEELSSALSHFKQAEALWKVVANNYLMPFAIHNQGEVFRLQKSYDSATHYFQISLALKVEYGDTLSIAQTLKSLGRVQLDLENPLRAIPFLEQGKAMFLQKQAIYDWEKCLLYLAEAYLYLNNIDSAGKLLAICDTLIDPAENRGLRLEWLTLAKEYQLVQQEWAQVAVLDKELDALRDTLFKEERLQVVQLRDAYRLEQEEQRTQRAENQRQLAELTSLRRQRISFTVGSIAAILLVGLVIIYRQRRQIGVLNEDLQRLNYDIRHRKKNDYLRILAYFSVAREEMPELSAVMQPVENMLMASAQVDDLLYRQQGDRTIGIKSYLENLLQELQEALSLNQPIPVAWQVQIEAIRLPTDHAAKLAFIVAEWVTNIYKHSFDPGKGQQGAQVQVRIGQMGDQVQVELMDNGKGVTEHTLEQSTGLGWKLIKGFISNLRGQLSLGSEMGARFILTFPVV